MSASTKSTIGSVLSFVGAVLEGTGIAWWVGAILMVAGAALSYAGATQAKKEAERRARAAGHSHPGVRGNVRGSFEHHMMVFGRCRVGGLVCMFGSSGSTNLDLYLGIEHSIVHAGGCDSVGDVWVDDVRVSALDFDGSGNCINGPYKGLLSTTFHAGLGTQAADASLVSLGLDYSDAYRRGICWSSYKLTRSTDETAFRTAFPSGFPTMTSEIRGIKCYDPRLDSANGGSGAQRLSDQTCTYSRTGTTVTITLANHLYVNGQSVQLKYTSGTATDGSYVVAGATTNTFTVTDPNSGSTSGNATIQAAYSWVWTDTPALCASTYAIMAVSDGGEGIPSADIDWASVAAAANTCEETISVPVFDSDAFWINETGDPFWGTDSALFWTTRAMKRFRCNGALSTGDKREVNQQKLLDSMWGRRVQVGTIYKYYAGAYRTPTLAIDDTWLAGPVKIAMRTPLEQLYNAVRINFDDRTQDYKTVEAPPFTSATYETQDGGYRVWRDITLPMVSDGYNAQYIGMIAGAQSRKQKIIELSCNFKALDAELWETATISLPGIDLSPYVWRLQSWEPTDQGFLLTFMEDASAVYTPGTFVQQDKGTPPVIGSEIPPAPTGLTATPTADGIRLDFTPNGGFAFAKTVVQVSLTGRNIWGTEATIDGDATSYISTRLDGVTYDFRLLAKSRYGILSTTPSATATATAKIAADAASVEVLNGSFEFGDKSWTTKSPGFSIVFDTTNALAGSYVGKFDLTYGTGYMVNDKLVPTTPGYTVNLFASIKTSAGGVGNGYARVTFYDATQTIIGYAVGPAVSGSAYAQSRVVAVAPANAYFASGGVYADGGSSGSLYYDYIVMTHTPPEPYNLTVAGSNQQLGDQRNVQPVVGANVNPALRTAGSPLSAFDAGSNATITIAASSIQMGFGIVNYNSGSISGLAYSTTYYVYCDDPNYAGGAVTYFATTSANVLTANSGRVYIDQIVTPASGAGPTGGHDGPCVQVDMFIGGKMAIQAVVGEELHAMNDDKEFLTARLEGFGGVSNEPCVEIKMIGGAVVVVSLKTPITTDKVKTQACHLLPGDRLACRYGEVISWEPVETVKNVGICPVARLHVFGMSYAAGARKEALVYTHNPAKP
jgi:hypothetical protein